jgi:hypothetical protein
MRYFIIAIFIFGIFMATIRCGESPKVIQGIVASYDARPKVLVIKDEHEPYTELTISLMKSEVSKEPAVGEKIRVSYRETDGQLNALRVMSLAKTDAKGKGE